MCNEVNEVYKISLATEGRLNNIIIVVIKNIGIPMARKRGS